MPEKKASSFPRPDQAGWLGGAAIALAAVAAYANSLRGALVYDDQGSIVDNRTIRHLADLGSILTTPGSGATAQGRPLLNFSFALNYAFGGTSPAGYHVVNIALQAVAGMLLFGIIRRTLRRDGIAFVAALLWTVHPLQTEAVTYVVQRAESLMGLFYLLTFYAFIRAATSRSAWLILSWAACLAGMATKEVMVSAPLMLFLYDRTFVAGTFREAWRARRRFYLGLAATWVLLAALVVSTGGNRGGSVGFGVGNPWWAYALTQFIALAHYLKLAIWPAPLVFDYGAFWVRSVGQVLPSALIVTALAVGSVWAFFRSEARYRAAGFAGIFFFAILAPTSLLPGTTQMIVEHRMYLPLAAVVVVLVAGVERMAPMRFRSVRLRRESAWGPCAPPLVAGCALALAAICLTHARNDDYRSAEALWTDTVNKRPGNAVAHYNLAYVEPKTNEGRARALAEYRRTLQLDPTYWQAEIGLGDVYASDPSGAAEAVLHYRTALRLNPHYANGYDSLGNVLVAMPGKMPAAIEAYQSALRVDPHFAPAHYNLGVALASIDGQGQAAVAEFQAALKIDPDYAEAHNNLGMALASIPGGMADAAAQYRAAIRLRPDYAEAHNNLANLLAAENRPADAVAEFEAALRADPNRPEIHYNAAVVLLSLPGRTDDAAAHLQAALRLRPDFDAARQLLAQIAASAH